MNTSQAESLRTVLSYSPNTPSHSEHSVCFGRSVPENKMEPGTPLYQDIRYVRTCSSCYSTEGELTDCSLKRREAI